MYQDLELRIDQIKSDNPDDFVFHYAIKEQIEPDKIVVWVNPEYPSLNDYIAMGKKLKAITKEINAFRVIFIGKTKAKSTSERREYLKNLFNDLPNLKWAYFVFERGIISLILLKFIMGRNFSSFSIHKSIKDVIKTIEKNQKE